MKKKHIKKKHVNQFFFSLPKAYPYYFKNKKFYKNNHEKTKTKNFLNSRYLVGLRSLESAYLTHNSLEACLKFLKKFAGVYYGVCGFNFKLLIFPDFWLTAKPKETRMGKGKGSISKKIYRLRTGSTILEFFYSKESHLFCTHLLQKIRLKLPIKNSLIYKFW